MPNLPLNYSLDNVRDIVNAPGSWSFPDFYILSGNRLI